MNIYIIARDSRITDSMKEYMTDKLSKIEKYSHKNVDAHIALDSQKYRFIADIHVNTNITSFHCKEADTDMFTAIDRAVDKVERHMRKAKEKVQNHKVKNIEPRLAAEEATLRAQLEDDEIEKAIIHTDLPVPELTVAEAIRIIDESHDHFELFINKDTQKVTVISKNSEHSYEMIDREGKAKRHPEKALFNHYSLTATPAPEIADMEIAQESKDQFKIDTMTVAQATRMLQKAAKEYLVFAEKDREVISLLFYRKDGKFGLINDLF